VRNAQITLPLKGAAGKIDKAQLNNSAPTLFSARANYVSQAEGIFCGVRISATGQLIKRENYQPSPQASEEEWQKRISMLQRLVGRCGSSHFLALVLATGEIQRRLGRDGECAR